MSDGEHTPRNGAPDPNLDEKLDQAFGPPSGATTEGAAPEGMEELAAEVRQHIEANGPIEGTTALLLSAAGWQAPPSDPLGLPAMSLKRGGIRFPAREDDIPRGWPMIWTLLWRVMAEVGYVAKDEQYSGGGVRYNFRGIDATVNALGPAFRRHGVIPVPKLKKIKYRDTMTASDNPKPAREVTVTVKYSFVAPDGSKATAVVPGEALDHSDKGSAKAMSVAFRIVLLQIFALPTTDVDPDASYHTRDGVGPMSGSVAKLLRDRIGVGQPGMEELADAAELERLWPIVLEHSAAERTVQPEDTMTWAQAFVSRFTALIEEIETYDEGRAVKAVVDRMGLGKALGVQLNQRAAFIKERTAKTFDHCMEQVLQAKDRAGLVAAKGCAEAAVEARVLSAEQAEQVAAVARERWTKVPEVHVEPEPPTEEPEYAPFIPAEGPDWERFVAAADAPNATLDRLKELLYNEHETLPYAGPDFGAAGIQRVADAAARAHRRDHTIDNTERAEIEQAIRERADHFGIEWNVGYQG